MSRYVSNIPYAPPPQIAPPLYAGWSTHRSASYFEHWARVHIRAIGSGGISVQVADNPVFTRMLFIRGLW